MTRSLKNKRQKRKERKRKWREVFNKVLNQVKLIGLRRPRSKACKLNFRHSSPTWIRWCSKWCNATLKPPKMTKGPYWTPVPCATLVTPLDVGKPTQGSRWQPGR